MAVPEPTEDVALFKGQLARYKQLIDDDIAAYSRQLRQDTLKQYGANARLATDTYLDILERGGKRIRGALVLNGYEMSGGTDMAMALEAARAIEMIHAYILIIDDIQDRSPSRRGGPTAHYALASYHKQNELADDSEHFGVAIALDSALVGSHAAQLVLANLKVAQEARLKVIGIVNQTMLVTAHGQTNDIMNEVVATVDLENIERVLEWKTAHYSFMNPLHVGMTLAGVSGESLGTINDYAMHTGKAFQITDDILGIFGNEHESGKSPLDDIREGKRTVLTAYALEHAQKADQNFLIQMLGNHTLTPAEFEQCKGILKETGALEYARGSAKQHVTEALLALDKESAEWEESGIQFLRSLANYLLVRVS